MASQMAAKKTRYSFRYLLGILFICHTIPIITKRCQKKNEGRDGEEA